MLLFESVVADAVGGFLQFARRIAFVTPHLAGHLVELLLELVDLGLELVLPLADLAGAIGSSAAGLGQRHRLARELLMLAGDVFGLLLSALHVALASRALLLLEPPLRFTKLAEGGVRLTGAARVSRRCRPPHRVGGLPHLLRRLRKIGTIAFARQALELTSGFFRLFRERALAGAAALAALPGECLLALPLGFLLLPSRKLAQLLHQRIDLLIGLLLLRALRRLVLIRQLVEVLLEQIGEILRHRSRSSAATAASAALLSDLFFVLFLSPLKLLKRAVLRRQRVRGGLCLKLGFRGAHFINGFRQQLRNLQECGVRLDQPAVHAAHEAFHLLPELGLR